MNKTFGAHGTIMKGLTYGSSKFQKEKRKYDADKISEEKVAENVPNLVKCTNLQVQAAQGISKRQNPPLDTSESNCRKLKTKKTIL